MTSVRNGYRYANFPASIKLLGLGKARSSSQQCLATIFHHVLLLAGEDDLRDVRSAVADLAARWKDLGISLGICLSDLDAIFSTNPQSPHDCLRETLALWLKQNYNVRTTLMLPHCTMCPLYESCITDHIIHFEYCIQSFTNSGIIIP